MDASPFKSRQMVVVITLPQDSGEAFTPKTVSQAIKTAFPEAKYVQVWGNLSHFLKDLAPSELIHGIEDDDDDPFAIHQPIPFRLH